MECNNVPGYCGNFESVDVEGVGPEDRLRRLGLSSYSDRLEVSFAERQDSRFELIEMIRCRSIFRRTNRTRSSAVMFMPTPEIFLLEALLQAQLRHRSRASDSTFLRVLTEAVEARIRSYPAELS